MLCVSLCQVVMNTVCSVEVLASACNASLLTPPCRVSVCLNVAETTSWMPPPKSANVRDNTLLNFLFFFFFLSRYILHIHGVGDLI